MPFMSSPGIATQMGLFILKTSFGIIGAKAGIRAPGSRRNLGGENPPPGEAHPGQWDRLQGTVWTDRMLESFDKRVKGGRAV